jgi:hypothetical protein
MGEGGSPKRASGGGVPPWKERATGQPPEHSPCPPPLQGLGQSEDVDAQ